MTVAKSLPLQQAVYQAVSAAVAPLPVYDHAPTTPPPEFVRLDGFNINDLGRKNGEIARHSFEVHHFLRPTAEKFAVGQKRTKEILALAHAAVMAADLAGSLAQFEYLDVSPDEDGVSMHGRARYSVVL